MLELSGPPVAEAVYQELQALLATLPYVPHLRVVRLGDDPASVAYVRLKDRQAKRLGLSSQVDVFPESTSQEELLAHIAQLNADPQVDGILVQSPVPKQVDFNAVLEAIDPQKDVDGLTPVNAGRMWMGLEALESCTPAGIMRILKHYQIPLAGKEVVIVGRSNLVGKPLAALMLREHATVTIAHSRTQDLAAVCRRADILVAAVGKAGLITPEMVRPGAVVVDVGINRVGQNEKGRDILVGDVAPGVAAVASALTPVPGGVGPMTVAMLLYNTVMAAMRRRARPMGERLQTAR
ncbi:bifunctional methylenetetrahydrofolate dehydrogenase/methenyltetrahydrofolate cyclohydrolase FolD [Meiothermus taiwanensis]|jgi:methylenetetrahydrofolate dehydrogenase (NADP+)/methenyltetrahydrofolate cyclohydrolase|uniref:Bifunctional protein FolD n=1 Tax=Meiothermus taiwanensis WR-220 TaxID=1339250 RepID=A0ABN5LYI6_9DEIN|nr:bifunctional methylenetetrahydrofolate dehydrogenase/methenyltetrahydrofolate cyclohydrolase FolD [Meiothermus taiwanensis]AWR87226.1 Methylenetetrahydrofolate dehydrogenase (NADP(+)) [Meiothermus taiwanensis WR-220]KIQ53487.1 methenyltetrahydrofolate cyclohydrolase [Meiothermus taiwanensis]